jgi:hypothetical protein
MTYLDVSNEFAAGAIVTADYLPWARVTASSFADHNPGRRFAVVIVDEPDMSQLRAEDRFELLRPANLGIDDRELAWMRLIYNGLELCCALKPWLLKLLLADAPAALYLDSDLLVFDSLRQAAELATRAGVVVSPHALEPRIEDGLMPGDDSLLQVGQFNAGFIAVGRTGIPFLDWWAQRLARGCTSWDPSVPRRFLDQRWLDLVLNYFPFAVHRDRGANVARWNLAQRRLEMAGDRYTVDGEPLRFFHFSGFDPGEPAVLSRLQPPHPRIDLSRCAPLRRLVGDYVEQLHAAGWVPRRSAAPTPTRDGLTSSPPVRAAVRAALVQAERLGVAPERGPADWSAVRAWLRAPASAGGTPWYLWGLWASNATVRSAFPRIPGPDEHRYQSWSVTDGVACGLVPAPLAGPATPLELPGLHGFVVLVDADEVLADSHLLAELSQAFGAQVDATFLLRAGGADPDALMRDFAPLLARSGLDGDDSPDFLAVIDAAAPSAFAPHVHAHLTRRSAHDGLAAIPRASNAWELRRMARPTPLRAAEVSSAFTT